MMTDYIREIKRQFVKVYSFTPLSTSTKHEYNVRVPDGEYPMTIEGRLDKVCVRDGKVSCCNFE